MTPEEAVEEVLQGPYAQCWRCKGAGEVDVAPYKNMHTGDTCPSCFGHGKYVRGDYNRACVELGRPTVSLPKPPEGLRKGQLVDFKLFGHAISLEEASRLFNGGVLKAQQEASFRREYLGTWIDAKDDDFVKDYAEKDHTVSAAMYAMTATPMREDPVTQPSRRALKRLSRKL